ncbi:MAG: hypothetical protein WAL04_01615 [Acidimicrobiales bacterium]
MDPSRSEPALDSQELERLRAARVYDPGAPDAEGRLALFEHLVAVGATVEQMIEADASGRLRSLGGDLILYDIGEPKTVQEVAELAAISVGDVLRIRMATGFAHDETSLLPAWTAEDMAGFTSAGAVFGEAAILAFSRVMGASASRIAEAALGLFLTEVEQHFSAPGVTELQQALAVEQASASFEGISRIFTHLLREHLMLAIRRQRAMTSRSGAVGVGVCVGFVDLAGSTEWAAALELRAQADAIARFESLAWDTATSHDGRIVKLIGDEVMFTATDPLEACRVALELCAAVEVEPSLPSARGAVGYGDVVHRDGDCFGPLVHLVARAVKAAAVGDVVVTRRLRDECEARVPGALCFDDFGSCTLRGIDHAVELYSARPSGA